MIDETNILPITIRSDRGVETPMMANAHIQLHAALNPSIDPSQVYWYGTSTLNQKIESWWRQMSKSQTLAWKVNQPVVQLLNLCTLLVLIFEFY